jgi:hypothetical protein
MTRLQLLPDGRVIGEHKPDTGTIRFIRVPTKRDLQQLAADKEVEVVTEPTKRRAGVRP